MLELIAKTTKDRAGQTPTLTLPLYMRQKSRQRVSLDDGREAVIVLPRGSVLYNDDLLVSRQQEFVRVRAAEESLSVVSCAEVRIFARACYHLGNRHVPLQIEETRIAYLRDHVIDDMLAGLGLRVDHLSGPFEPEPGAYFSAPHRH